MKDLPKVPTQRLEWDSNPRPSDHKAPNVPLRDHDPIINDHEDHDEVADGDDD